jgi:cyanophycinase
VGQEPARIGPPEGALVVVGGAMADPEIFERFIELAGGSRSPIVLIPTAGEDDSYDQSFEGIDAWRSHGARNLTILHTLDRKVADSEAFVAPLKNAQGVFIFGGRQWRLAEAYGGTRTEVEIRRVLERGGVVGGTSAGASILGSYLVRGDTRSNELVMGDHSVGFGFLRNVGIDQHVLTRNRHFDLIELVEARPELLGLGIDENTALVIEGDHAEVIGQSYVLVFDNRTTVRNGGQFYFLAPGDSFNLATREARRPTADGTIPALGVERNPWR